MAIKFETVEWAATANVYEVNLRQYTAEGTIAAFQKELPRLRNMGIDILWFMPLTPISIEKRQGSLGSYYACSNYTSVSTEFGTIGDFKELVITAHSLGFKVIIDWVANHTGYDHVWTKQHPDFYKKNNEGNFYCAYGWVDVIDLDYGNRNLWEVMAAEMDFWVKEFDIDGFRCDMAHLFRSIFGFTQEQNWRKEKNYSGLQSLKLQSITRFLMQLMPGNFCILSRQFIKRMQLFKASEMF